MEGSDCRRTIFLPQRAVKSLAEADFAWVHEQDPAIILSRKTRDSLNYSINQEKYLKVFLNNSNIPIDSSATERAIRLFTIGRANWHIIDTIHGAEANKLKIYEHMKAADGDPETHG